MSAKNEGKRIEEMLYQFNHFGYADSFKGNNDEKFIERVKEENVPVLSTTFYRDDLHYYNPNKVFLGSHGFIPIYPYDKWGSLPDAEDELRSILSTDYEKFVVLLGENIKDDKFRDAIKILAKEKPIKYEEMAVECDNLLPTQNEISLEKSLLHPLTSPYDAERFLKADLPIRIKNRTILTCDYGKYIIDGHHRWSQVFVVNPKAKIDCVDFYEIKNPISGLKATQLGVSADLGYVPTKEVRETNLLTISEEKLKEYVNINITVEVRNIFNKYGIVHPEEHIWNNVLLLKKKNKPIENASIKKFMPQTDLSKNYAEFTPDLSGEEYPYSYDNGGQMEQRMKQLWYVTDADGKVKNISSSVDKAEVFLADKLGYSGNINYVKVPLADWEAEKVNVGNIKHIAKSFWQTYRKGGQTKSKLYLSEDEFKNKLEDMSDAELLEYYVEENGFDIEDSDHKERVENERDSIIDELVNEYVMTMKSTGRFYSGGGDVVFMPKQMIEEIKESVKLGHNKVQEGLITPKRKGVMLINDDYQVRGVYPIELKEYIEQIVEKELNKGKSYDNGGTVRGYADLSKMMPTVINEDTVELTQTKKIKEITDGFTIPVIDIVKKGSFKFPNYENNIIKNVDDAVNIMRYVYGDSLNTYEQFFVLILNNANEIQYIYVHSKGGLTGTIADLRMVFAVILKRISAGVIIVHNHPSGNLIPSDADRKLTDKFKEVCKLLDIGFVDHIIISNKGYYSFTEGQSHLRYDKGGDVKLSKSEKEYRKEVDKYNWFVVDLKTEKVISGWEFRPDAYDSIKNDSNGNLKVISEKALKMLGIKSPKSNYFVS